MESELIRFKWRVGGTINEHDTGAMLLDHSGDWVTYDEAQSRIAQLTAQPAEANAVVDAMKKVASDLYARHEFTDATNTHEGSPTHAYNSGVAQACRQIRDAYKSAQSAIDAEKAGG